MGQFSTFANLILEATTVLAAETLIGVEIEAGYLEALTLFVDYTMGDEDSLTIIPYSMYESGGDGFQFQTWDEPGLVREVTFSTFTLTASGKYMLTFDISGVEWVKFHQQAIGGTPTGTIKAFYVVTGI